MPVVTEVMKELQAANDKFDKSYMGIQKFFAEIAESATRVQHAEHSLAVPADVLKKLTQVQRMVEEWEGQIASLDF